MKTKITLINLLFFVSLSILAQEITVTGEVTSTEDGIPVPGVNVIIVGTSRGVSTDFDGLYSINVTSGETLEFSSVGLKSVRVTIGNQTVVNVAMEPDIAALDEIVIIGYGTTKKADLTSAISTIESSALEKTPVSQVVQGFQGKVAGVQISSNGSPGSTPDINIRGLNSLYGNSAPLFVVDGMFYDNIDFLNASQIKDISILKDASASAIYGVRAANGVVLITTNGGQYNRDAEVKYSTYYGVRTAQNVLQMANAEQFTTFAYESGSPSEISSIEQAMQRFGRSRVNPNIPDVNTDWYKEVLREASTYNHDLQVNGGSEKVAYSLGGNFSFEDGILDMKNNYERAILRAKVDAKANDWLTVGGNMSYTRSVRYAEEGSAWQLTYYAVPILPVYDSAFTNADPTPYSSAKYIGYRDHQNPFPLLDNSDRRGERRRTTASFYADFQILPSKLNFKSTISYNYRGDNERIVLLPYYIADDYQRAIDDSSITLNNGVQEDYIWDNVLTYTDTFGDHDFSVMAATSFRDNYFRSFGTRGNFDPGAAFVRDNDKTWYIQNTSGDSQSSYDGGNRFYGFSYFGRASYKFKNRYLAYATFRAEGSNKYDQTYVYLPAFGLGWVVTEESFMENVDFINFLKFRAGWGRLANDAVPPSIPQSANTVETVFDDNRITGFNFSTAADKIGWEYTEELNVGLTSTFFNDRLSFDADYFIKDTKNLVIPLLPVVGTEVSFQNVGSVRNQGIEIATTWKGKINEDFSYSISGNFSTIDNKITDLNGQSRIERGAAEFRQLLVVGQPINVFYGWDIEGVYQNSAEVSSDPAAQDAIAGGTTVSPGYFKFRDLNGDGVLDASDRKYLGSPVPTYYFGGNIGVNYKGFGLSVDFYGQGGNVILNRNRAEVIRTSGRNIDAELAINRWHGEGTTNSFPSSLGYRQSWNTRMSKFWLEEGDFIRIQNIQFAYTLSRDKLPEMTFFLTAERPFQWSKSFNGFNPEVGFDGIDIQTYPTASIYTVGISVKL